MYFTANPGTPLNWVLFLPCALHALIVTAMIFADISTPTIYRKSPRDKTCPCSMRQREAGRMPHCFLWYTENAYLQGMIAADNESPSMLWAELSRPLAVQLSPRKVRMERALLTSWYCLGLLFCWKCLQKLFMTPACMLSALPCSRDSRNPQSSISNAHFCNEVAELWVVFEPWGL